MRNLLMAMLAVLPVLAWAQPASAPTPAAAPAAASTSAAADTTRPARASRRSTRVAAAATANAAAPAARTTRAPSAAQLAQRQRMRDCNAEARSRTLTGVARSTFMRPCLGGRMPAA